MTEKTNGEVRELKEHIDWLSGQITDHDEIIARLDEIERIQSKLTDSFLDILRVYQELSDTFGHALKQIEQIIKLAATTDRSYFSLRKQRSIV